MREVRSAQGVEAAGLRLTGWVIRWSDQGRIPDGRRERIAPGAFGPVGDLDVVLNAHHDRGRPLARTQGGGLTLRETRDGVMFECDLPNTQEAKDVVALVRAGVVRGASVEMIVLQEEDAGGVRVIERAQLVGLSLVDDGAYPRSTVEARLRRRPSSRTVKAMVPTGVVLGCECLTKDGKPGVCRVDFTPAWAADAVEQFEAARDRQSGHDILVVRRNYSSPVASAARGGLLMFLVGDALGVEVELPDGPVSDQVVADDEAATLLMRPIIAYDADSEYEDTDDVRTVTRARIRAWLLGVSDTVEGWPEVEIVDSGIADMEPTPDDLERLREVLPWL